MCIFQENWHPGFFVYDFSTSFKCFLLLLFFRILYFLSFAIEIVFALLLSTPAIRKVYLLFPVLLAIIFELNKVHPNESTQTIYSDRAGPAREPATIAVFLRGSKQKWASYGICLGSILTFCGWS